MEKRAKLICSETGRVYPALEMATRFVRSLDIEYHPTMAALTQLEIQELLRRCRKLELEKRDVVPIPECPTMREARLQRFSAYRNEKRFRNVAVPQDYRRPSPQPSHLN